MGQLLARIRRLPETGQKVVVFAMLAGTIAIVILIAQALG